MRNNRISALLATTALASATLLGGAGIASAAGASDTITGSDAKVTATANENCEITFGFVGDTTVDRLKELNWVVDYRVDGEEPDIVTKNDDGEVDEQLSVYRPVVASNQATVDALVEKYDYNVKLLDNTVNLNDVVGANDSGEHTVTFKFYRGSADWQAVDNKGEVTVTGCEKTEENNGGLLGSVVGSLDVFGSLEGMS